MDRGAWQATGHGIIKSRTQLSTHMDLKDFPQVLTWVGRTGEMLRQFLTGWVVFYSLFLAVG